MVSSNRPSVGEMLFEVVADSGEVVFDGARGDVVAHVGDVIAEDVGVRF